MSSKIQNLKLIEYQCQANLNLYDSPKCTELATQAAVGRHLHIVSIPDNVDAAALQVYLCEDEYPGWLAIADVDLLQPASNPYQANSVTAATIQNRLPEVIAFTQQAMQQPNYYLWGGTTAPNYDCSGLMQAAFASVGVWLPRDAYQQEGFTQPIPITEVQPGDLVFFGTPNKATHVGLYLVDGCYIHSSGKDKGRNGIGVDQLTEQGSAVSRSYYQQLRGACRVVKSYEPQRLARTQE